MPDLPPWATGGGGEQTIHKGAANGYAPLDATSRLPIGNAPVSAVSASTSFVASGGDDTASMQAKIDATSAAGGGTIYGPPNIMCQVSAPLILKAGVCLWLDPTFTIKATAAIVGGAVIDTSNATLLTRPVVVGGIIDCNSLADDGLFLRNFAHATVEGMTVLRYNANAYVFGDTGAPNSSFELMGTKLFCSRGNTDTVPTGSRGIWTQNCTDSEFIQCILVGADTGIRNDDGSNHFHECHVWGYNGHCPSIGFDDNSDGHWIDCHVDNPVTGVAFGFRLRTNNGSVIVGGSVNNGLFGGVDNVVTGVQVDSNSPNFLIVGLTFNGLDGTHRIAKAVNYSTSTGGRYQILGCRYNNVVSAPNEAIILLSNTVGLQIENGLAVAYFISQGANKSVQLWNGGKLIGSTDNGATLNIALDASLGTIATGKAVTGSRPSAVTAGAAAAFYDTTLSKPIFSDGTVWRDAAGTAV